MLIPVARRWPAYATALAFLGYAAGKATFALQDRLGFPSGPVVAPTEAQQYAVDAAAAQWLAAATGVLGTCIALATVTRFGRRVPRKLMLLVLAGALLAVGAGAAIMVVDAFGGPGPGWQWHHGLVGIVVTGLLLTTVRSYAQATTVVAARG